MNPSAPRLDELALETRLRELRAGFRGRDELVAALERDLRTAADEDVFRINPVRYATDRGWDEDEVIELFLHARRAGLFVMEWQYVCPVCGLVVESFHALNAAGEHYFCKTCIADREADLSDYVEVGFTASKAVRVLRYHSPDTLLAADFQRRYLVSTAALARDGSSLRNFYDRYGRVVAYVEPGDTRTFELNLEPGFYGLSHGPEMLVLPSAEARLDTLDFTHREGRSAEKPRRVAPGPLTYRLTNASSERILTFVMHVPAAEISAMSSHPPGIRLRNFLSGSRLLSTQAFLDLFPTETVMSAGGLAIRNVALLFTDIQGSTALYERVGDLKAFTLVRQHFGLLRDQIAANRGALVKTIGDAVMGSFHDPLDAVRATIGILEQIRRFNDAAGEELLVLKIGAHAGPCLAVTLNERLDYFGQTVNLAARVQGQAAAGEICLSDRLAQTSGAEELVAPMRREIRTVRVKGIDRDVVVHVLGSSPPEGH